MRWSILLLVLLLASACSGSAVVGEVDDSAQSAVVDVAPNPSPAESEQLGEPEIYVDDFGEFYVPRPGAGSEPARPDRAALSSAEIAAEINAGVPAGHELSFDWQTMALTDEHEARALVPIEWKRTGSDYEYEEREVDFHTEYEVDSGCQGFCAPQNWERLMNDPADSPLRLRADQPIEILVDQTLSDPAGRLLVIDRAAVPTGGAAVAVEVVRWSDDADRFLNCKATLSPEDRVLWPTFADVCLAAVGEWIG